MSAPRSSAPRLAFRFGDYRLDVAARELHRRGELVVLSPKVFDCLAWLFEHRDRAVGRDELSAAVWGRADITDAQIDQLIRKVRRVLGDSGSDQEVIRTVPRFGYRWVAEVDTDAGPAGAAVTVENEAGDARSEAEETALAEGGMAVAAEPADREPQFPAPVPAPADGPASGRRRIPALLWGASLAAMVAVVVGGYLGWRGRAAGPGAVAVAPPAAGRTSYAVLPVTLDGEADSEWAWLRLGLMDLISARLREGGLAVVPASNIVALIDKKAERPLDPAAVQAATGARVLVQPSVRRTDGGWRLRLEIEGAEAAAREMEVHADDAVGSARAAADRLLVLLGQAPVPDERDGDAGREVLARRIDAAISGGDYDAARQLLDTVPSARRDGAEFRLRRAYVERAVGHGTAARELFQAVLDADTARTLAAPIRTEALIGLGVMQLQGGDAAAARPRLDEAIELAQRERLPLAYADAMASRASLNAAEGREAEADSDFAQARIALEMAADSLGVAELEANQAGTLLTRHRYAEARPLLERSIERMQRFPPGETLITALGNQIFMHLAFLEPREALAVAERARDSVARVGAVRKRQSFAIHEARALMANGRLEQARRLIEAIVPDADAQQAPDLHAAVLGSQAHLAFEAGQWREAADLAGRHLQALAVPALSTPLYARTRATSERLRIRALLRASAPDAAAEALAGFSAWAGHERDSSVAAQFHLARAEVAAAGRHDEAAGEAFEAALASVGRGAAPADVARVAVAYGQFLIDSGRPGEATRIAGQVSRWSGQCFECAALQARLYRVLGQDRLAREALATAHTLAGERQLPAGMVEPEGERGVAGRRIELPPVASASSSRR